MTTLAEHQDLVWKAGEVVLPGTYIRIDDDSYRKITLTHKGPLPATFDGHVALYCMMSKIAAPHSNSTQIQAEASKSAIGS